MAVCEHFLTISLAKVFSFSFIKHRIYEKPCSLGQSKLPPQKHVKFKGGGTWSHFQLARCMVPNIRDSDVSHPLYWFPW